MLKLFCILFLMLGGCGKATKDDDKLDVNADLAKKREEVHARFLNYMPEGWVVAKRGDEQVKLGDSLIWTGIALAGLDCDKAKEVLEGLTQYASSHNGWLARHPSFGKKTDSIDGYVGLNWGLIRYAKKCKDLKNAAKLYDLTRPHYRALLTEGLYYVLDRGDKYFGRAGITLAPSKTTETLFDAAITGWALGVVEGKKACYKLHLATLMAAFVEESGASVNSNEFCKISKKADLPFTDAYCGNRSKAKDFLQEFKYDEWENRNQRCPAWESENNSGTKLAGIDFLQVYDYTF